MVCIRVAMHATNPWRSGTRFVAFSTAWLWPTMAKPKNMAGRKMVSLPPHLWEAVEDYRFDRRYKTESEAIRRLVEAGLRLELVEARTLSLEKQIIEIAQRAGVTEAEVDKIRAELAMSRRLVEPLGPDPEA